MIKRMQQTLFLHKSCPLTLILTGGDNAIKLSSDNIEKHFCEIWMITKIVLQN